MRLFLFLAALPLLADPLVIGHRGCRALRPENTLPAFEHALAVGADVLELDVVVTRDNALVVHHDLELNGKPVRKMTLDEVRAFDRGGTPSAGFPRQRLVPGAKVPLLEEVFAFAKQRQARLMVETKVDPDVKPEWFAAAIDQLIRKYGLSERILLQSFDHRTLHAMRRLNPEVGLVLLNPARRLEDYVGPAKELGPKAIQFVNFRVIDEEIVRKLHAAGIRVFSGTTDDRGAWARLRALGVDGILTDDPEDLRGILGRVVMTERRDGVVIEDLVFRNSFQEYDTAYRVCPVGANGVAAILFVHWLEPDDSTSNRSQFLGEAVGLARRGACSLLVTAMWAGPDWFRHRDPAKDRVATERQRKRLGDALDFLLETPGIDRARVAYVGHDFGGMFGALMAADERRVGVWALQAATPRWHEWYLLGRELDPAAREKVAGGDEGFGPGGRGWQGDGCISVSVRDQRPFCAARTGRGVFRRGAGGEEDSLVRGGTWAQRRCRAGSRGVAGGAIAAAVRRAGRTAGGRCASAVDSEGTVLGGGRRVECGARYHGAGVRGWPGGELDPVAVDGAVAAARRGTWGAMCRAGDPRLALQ